MADEKDKHPKCVFDSQDVVSPGPVLPDGTQICLRHTADHELRIGTLLPLVEGQSIPENARLVTEEDGLYKVGKSIHELKAGAGPAQVATDDYRKNWERTFG